MKLTPLTLTLRTVDLRYVESIKGILLIANKGGLNTDLLTILTDAGLNPMMEDNGEILITYMDLLTIEGFSDSFAKWAIQNNLLVDYECDH
jgi:hypothetical protein